MDVYKALRELYEEKKRLDRVIASLEVQSRSPSGNGHPQGRRGRKSMSASERLEVSRRMSSYWAARKAAGSASVNHNLEDCQAEAASQATA